MHRDEKDKLANVTAVDVAEGISAELQSLSEHSKRFHVHSQLLPVRYIYIYIYIYMYIYIYI